MEIIAVIPVFFMNSALPDLTDSFIKNKDRFFDIISKSFKYLTLIAAPIMAGGIALAFGLTFIISSPQYLSGYHCKNDIRVLAQTAEKAMELCSSTALDPIFAGKFVENYKYIAGSDVALKIVLIAIFKWSRPPWIFEKSVQPI